ncbi:hypothetical protein N1851_013823 [Merluccius polli]|uniref:Tyr recombinase domain-containing protein n=1 Tax=Merluccius polli TaxID=89951 RepID=A0AA47MUJ2_MERPO|nr:hypothetical protein N1851_013823 [Merluccius polli]
MYRGKRIAFQTKKFVDSKASHVQPRDNGRSRGQSVLQRLWLAELHLKRRQEGLPVTRTVGCPAMAHLCAACAAPLEPEDGHDNCPPCLGLEHLREGLTDGACMNCRPLPWALRLDRLAEVEQRAITGDPSLLTGLPQNLPGRSRPRHGGAAAKGAPPRKKARGELSSKVDQLAADMEHMKSLLLALQPGTGRGQAGLQPDPPLEDGPPLDDALSLAASASFFNEASTEDDASHTLGEASCSSAQGSLQGAADTSMAGIMRGALARLGLDAPQTDPGQTSVFFRRNPAPATFTVPPSEEYVKELHACWRDSRALSHSTTDARTLAAMQDAAQVGLGRMPPVEPAIASLILAPDEALRPDARCPRPQCRVTDDLLTKAYDSAARMGRIGNSLSHLLLGLSTSLQQAQVEPSLQSLSDASLQAFALMARELGRTMSTLVQTRRQVWLAQSPLTETCRKVLRAVLFGAAALEALERAARARQTRQELSGLHRSMSAPSRPRGPWLLPSGAPSLTTLVAYYENRWKLFSDWCNGKAADPVRCPVAIVLEFLQSLLDSGRSHSTLRVYVAAISSRHEGVDGATVGCHRLVSLFLRGALRLRPPRTLRAPAWDLPLVLEAMSLPPFEPLTQVGLKWLSMKVAFLLAITSAKRVGELQALSVAETYLRWNPDGSGVVLWPNVAFLPKVLSRTHLNQPIRLARFDSPSEEGRSELLCPVRALRAYIAATAGIRQSEQLFVCHGGPNRGCALSKQRLSHWVVDAITHAYGASGRPPPSGVRCHSTRSVATSWAALRGVPLEAICAAASWATPGTFTRFYRVNVADHCPMAAVLRPSSADSKE